MRGTWRFGRVPVHGRGVPTLALVGAFALASVGADAAHGPRLDRSYGDDGVATADLGAHEMAVEAWAGPGGSTLVLDYAGGEDLWTIEGFDVTRWTRDGRLDPSFADRGVLRLEGSWDRLVHAALTPAGGLVVADEVDGLHRIRVFDTGGRPASEWVGAPSRGRGFSLADLAVSADRSIALLAHTGVVVPWVAAAVQPVVFRHLPDGRPDPSFGVEGAAPWVPLLWPGLTFHVQRIHVQDDGGVLLVGSARSPATQDVFVSRLAPDGRLDLDFGTAGVRFVGVEGAGDLVDVAFPDGAADAAGGIALLLERRTVTGSTLSGPHLPVTDVSVVRLDREGAVLSTWGSAGVASHRHERWDIFAMSLSVDATGGAVVGFQLGGFWEPDAWSACGAACPSSAVMTVTSRGFFDLHVPTVGKWPSGMVPVPLQGMTRVVARGGEAVVAGALLGPGRDFDLGLVRLVQ